MSKLISVFAFLLCGLSSAGCDEEITPINAAPDGSIILTDGSVEADSGAGETEKAEFSGLPEDATLTLSYPDGWYVSRDEGSGRTFSVADFPPPHIGLEEAIPSGITVFVTEPEASKGFSLGTETVSLKNGVWLTLTRDTECCESYWLSHVESGVTVSGYRHTQGAAPDALTEADRELIRQIAGSVSYVTD